MNNNMTNIRIDLGIDARRIMQQIMIDNQRIEEQLKQGIELALNDISEGEGFIQNIREAARRELEQVFHQQIFNWEFKEKLLKRVREKIEARLDEETSAIIKRIYPEKE